MKILNLGSEWIDTRFEKRALGYRNLGLSPSKKLNITKNLFTSSFNLGQNLKATLAIMLLFFATLLSASDVSISVDKRQIYQGDSVSFTISAKGDSVEFPKVDKIGNFDVQDRGTSYNIVMINGNLSKTRKKTYAFMPESNVTIPSFEVKVDGNIVKTKPIDIVVVKPSAQAGGAPFKVEMKLSKTSAMVGEPVKLDIIFKQRRDAKADRLNITPPQLQDFWAKEIRGQREHLEGNYIVQSKSFLLFPQKEGNFTIPAIEADVGNYVQNQSNDPFLNDPFFVTFNRQISWKRLFSNKVNLSVKPLPDNLEVYGDFTMSANVDKREVLANKPVNLTIKIKGSGNFDDIQKFNLNIPDAIVYADEPKVSTRIIGDKQVGEFTQKIAIIADRNYTIPAVEFSYFDAKTKTKKTIKSAPIKIAVKGGAVSKSTSPKIEEAPSLKSNNQAQKVIVKEDSKTKYIYLLIGLILGSFITFMALKINFKKPKKELEITKQISKAKDDKELYKILLPYAKEHEYLKEILEKLEENIYKNGKNRINKNDIIDYFDEVVKAARM